MYNTMLLVFFREVSLNAFIISSRPLYFLINPKNNTILVFSDIANFFLANDLSIGSESVLEIG